MSEPVATIGGIEVHDNPQSYPPPFVELRRADLNHYHVEIDHADIPALIECLQRIVGTKQETTTVASINGLLAMDLPVDQRTACRVMQALEDLGFAFMAPAKYVYVKAEASA